MICKNNECRAKLPDDAVFCLKCGTKQDVIENTEIAGSDDNIKESLSEEPIEKKTKKVAFVIIGILAVIALLYLIYAVSNNNNLYLQTTSPTTSAPVVETREYPMERCPIEITDISVSYDDAIYTSFITAKWNYSPIDSNLVIDKVIFNFTTYNGVGLSSPARYTAKGPFSDGVSYEEKWQSVQGSIDSAEIKEVEIYYTNNLIENYIEVEYETQAQTQQKSTNPKNEYKPRTNTLDDCPIKVNSYYSTYPNSADGVSFYIDWYSIDDKEIKYVYFTVTPYNRVNDKQYCEIRDHSTFNGSVTGPFYYGSADYSYWECAWYNSDIDHIELDKITIEYMDGTKRIYYN